MEVFMLWCSFVGSWLLFVGAVYQAVLELRDEFSEMNRFGETQKMRKHTSTVSAWWWLLPPIAILLMRRDNDRYQKSIVAAMPESEVEALVSFQNKANGWLLVAGGAFLIALKETYELVRGLNKPLLWLWIGIVLLPVIAVGYTASRLLRRESIIKKNQE